MEKELTEKEFKEIIKLCTNEQAVAKYENVVKFLAMDNNLMNFSSAKNWDNKLIRRIFNLTNLMMKHQVNYAYDFDHVNYALIAWMSENKEEDFNLLESFFKSAEENIFNNKVIELCNSYNDMETDFKII